MELPELDSYEEIIIEELAKVRAFILSSEEPSALRWPIERISLILDGVRHKYQALYENECGANNSIPEVETKL